MMIAGNAITDAAVQECYGDRVDHALDFLHRATGVEGLPSAWCSFDPAFGETFTGAETRDRLRRRLGVDFGLDMADEGFSAMLALALLHPPTRLREHELVEVVARQVSRCRRGHRYCFFPREEDFSADTDCTSMAAGALYAHRLLTSQQLNSTAQDLLGAAAPIADDHDDLHPGVMMVYWDDGREPHARARGRKHDAVACANTLYTLDLAEPWITGAGQWIRDATLRYVSDHLVSGRYLYGTRYYPSPAVFLHAASRLSTRSCAYASQLSHLLNQAYLTYRPQAGNALDQALLILTADNLGFGQGRTEQRARAALAGMQRPDGSWPACPYFRMGRFPVYFGSPHLTTLFALRALQPNQVAPRGRS